MIVQSVISKTLRGGGTSSGGRLGDLIKSAVRTSRGGRGGGKGG